MRSHLIAAIRARSALPAWRSRDGSVAVVVALLLVVLIGFAALGTEVVALLMTSRQMQSAADSAALAAATARTKGYPTAYADEAVAIARDRKFVNGATNPTTTVAVVSPPTSGAYSGNSAAVQVVITQVQPLLLTRLFRSTAYTLTARSVGLRGAPCGMALDGSAASALLASNGVTVVLDKCGVGSNSSSATAIRVAGGSSLAGGWLSVVGNTSVVGGSTLTIAGANQTGTTAVANPYAARVVPVPGTCLAGGAISNQTVALAPGTYCTGGINVGNASHVTLNGVYILKDSSLVVNGGSTLSGTATIVLTTLGTGTNIGSVTISNGSTINLTAPTTGTTAGMVFFQDIRAPTGGANTFTNVTATTLNGAVYFPNQTLNFSSGNSVASFCTLLIARKISFTGNTNLKANCTVFGTAGGALGRLVE